MWVGVKKPNYIIERDLEELILSSGHESLKRNNSSEYLILLIFLFYYIFRIKNCSQKKMF